MEYQGKKKNCWQKIDGTNGVIAIISCLLWGGLWVLKPTPLYVPPNDSGSSFPKDEKNILPTAIMGGVLAAVFVVVFIAAWLLSKFFPKYFADFNGWTFLWAFVAAEGISGFTVSIFKNYVGRTRPDLYSICGSQEINPSDPSTCPGLSASEFKDQFRSWPSGHSQTAMSGFVIIAFFVQRIIKSKNLVGTFCGSLFIILAIWCGATRIRDYKHRPDDVLAGFFVGYIFAQLVWLQMIGNVFPEEDLGQDNKDDKSLPDNENHQYDL
ncbi:PAP2 superfamily protein [Trichomonas vaginalis G3]|uniref:PAP2 superfamily protein n=1 Tax=Trichomonas vaginalis (strain ATCC PRA-98 / G3) TaxID=412133 RepID=A2DYB5_TRIV3|nr:phosphatidate phosphatase protein [Trichomonas vaginalis G3]EAY14592.1 PAP2 superfamily protein [Trichomonas vaginalis G3]KAI5526603.1 phosphatidate phosphatase protein [Trichomonas vaginalis G3]|eukprot:XP_001326815.1 PAP2 superfamily protein [Trichomonas vaginalis G3]